MRKRTKHAVVPPLVIAPAPGRWAPLEAFLERWSVLFAAGFVLLATVRIASTYGVFSHTFDELAHLACGMEWLEKGRYTYDLQHPPLARVITALLPKLFGAHGAGQQSLWDEGVAILMSQNDPSKTLALARAGVLPFFWIACWIGFAMARWIAGAASGVLAVVLISMSPAVLAHAGLVTTDMALTGMLLAATYSVWRWADEPTWPRAILMGAGTGIAVLAKLSAIPFLPSVAIVGCLLWLISERPSSARLVQLVRRRALGGAAAATIAVLVIWTGYRFSFGSVPGWTVWLPAPELFAGIQQVRHHDATGHLTFLMGKVNTVGWPYFYAAALAVKTPLPLLGLGIAGVAMAIFPRVWGARSSMLPAIVAGVAGYSSFFSQIRIGTRHVLPVTIALCVAAACCALWLLRRFESRMVPQLVVAVLVFSIAVSSIAAHPDYLAYFNAIAGSKPEAYLVDSDLDWGQDVKRLAARLKEAGAQSVFFNQYAPGDLRRMYGMPEIRPLDVNGPQPGWNAISITPMKYGLFGDNRYAYDPGFEFWPEQVQPVERIGRGILLYFQPPAENPSGTRGYNGTSVPSH